MAVVAESKPSLVGDFSDWSVPDFLESLAASKLSGWVEFVPSGIGLHLYQGDIISASGGEPLGSILLRRHLLSEESLQQALRLQDDRWLGELLMSEPFNISAESLMSALNTQILLAVNALVSERQACFMLYKSELAPPKIYTRFPIEIALTEARSIVHEVEIGALPLGAIFKLNPRSNNIQLTLTNDEWAVISLTNGRRSLRTILRLCITFEVGWLRAYRAALRLQRSGMLEHSSVPGVHEIIPKLSSNEFFSRDLTKLFLERCNGFLTVADIATDLEMNLVEAAEIMARLYREQRLEVMSGKRELDRLLEEF